MRVALTDLNLEQLFVVLPDERSYPLDEKIEAVSLVGLSQRLARL
jgi:hypothetical protein